MNIFNKKAETEGIDLLTYKLAYILLAVVLLILMSLFIYTKMNSAAIYEDYLTKEISKMINIAEPGDEIRINVQKATAIAQKNEVTSDSEIFQPDNANNQFCVKISKGEKTCHAYFNNVHVSRELKRGMPENYLIIKINEKPTGEQTA
jgi:hypothetical protein